MSFFERVDQSPRGFESSLEERPAQYDRAQLLNRHNACLAPALNQCNVCLAPAPDCTLNVCNVLELGGERVGWRKLQDKKQQQNLRISSFSPFLISESNLSIYFHTDTDTLIGMAHNSFLRTKLFSGGVSEGAQLCAQGSAPGSLCQVSLQRGRRVTRCCYTTEEWPEASFCWL